jgi:hypothetical protein
MKLVRGAYRRKQTLRKKKVYQRLFAKAKGPQYRYSLTVVI